MDSLGQCLTPEVAEKIAAIRTPEAFQARLDLLAERSTDGLLTFEEKQEQETYVHLIGFISHLQVKSRKLIKQVAAH